MDNRDAKYLYDAKKAGNSIIKFIGSQDFADYIASDLLRSAVERQFGVLGEALRRLRDRGGQSWMEALPGASEAIGFRNLLAHNYDSIDDKAVWSIAVDYLPRSSF